MRSRPWIVLLGALVACGGGAGGAGERGRVTVERGTVVRRAVATGRVEPWSEVEVTSTSGGTVHRLFVELGQKVAVGDPLAEVRPVITAQTMVAAERALRAALDGEENAREFLEGEHLLSGVMRFVQGRKNLERMQRQASLGREQAEEYLRLLREGKVDAAGREIDFVVRAPVAGHVLAREVRTGDPVVPASSYGPGTVLVVLADLDRMVFRGTVDEIDVGKLREGQAATVTLGALPEASVPATLDEIALRAGTREGSVVFDVRLGLRPPEGLLLRAGYSAVADIELQRASDVPVLPERVVRFRGGGTFVDVPGKGGGIEERAVELGVSDGITVEVRGGVAAGDVVLEAERG